MDKEGIVWLASWPKSGNTWVRLFLASYKAGGIPISPNCLPAEFIITDTRDRDYLAVSPFPIDKLGSLEILQLRGAALLHAISGIPERPVLVKTHSSNAILDGVRLMHPGMSGGAIYIVRDPRDVAVSMSRWTGEDVDKTIDDMANPQTMLTNPNPGAETIFDFMGCWSDHVTSWADAKEIDVTVMRYEDMVDDPFPCFRRILDTMGWKLNESRLAKAIEATSFAALRKFEDQNGFREAISKSKDPFFRSGKHGAWRSSLTAEQSGKIEAEHADVMRRFGYL